MTNGQRPRPPSTSAWKMRIQVLGSKAGYPESPDPALLPARNRESKRSDHEQDIPRPILLVIRQKGTKRDLPKAQTLCPQPAGKHQFKASDRSRDLPTGLRTARNSNVLALHVRRRPEPEHQNLNTTLQKKKPYGDKELEEGARKEDSGNRLEFRSRS
ncbi:hypothetical protein B0H17DRAFT_1128578 [Mycena rosella]|uniref:Uncharacterized protein n=1 Tax=Mycena rosella TaxID=1033263 RepID=A0AAD7DY58_MYCRO|nr:hypothetical protein B0H17DRAFT_1128578 [Mycena rosella]